MRHPDAWHEDRAKEECGVVAVYSRYGEAARPAFFALFALQHRGQESAGIAVSDGEQVRMHKDMGLVSQVFNEDILSDLPGHMAVGHTRYSTTGASVLRNAQPIYCTSSVGEIAVAHNGNLINAYELRKELEDEGERFDSTADSELIARLIVRDLHLGVENAISSVMRKLKGAYSCTVLTPRMLIGFRDPHGVRPLIAGYMEGGYLVASESCAFGPLDAKVEHELKPGEMVVVDDDGMRFVQASPPEGQHMCLFEFIYFARPDSRMFGTTLYSARERMGEELWREHPADADVVMPVPDSGVPAAIGYSNASGLPFREGMMKSRYIHRTFIQPDQRMRERGVRMKLTPLEDHIEGRRLVIVDDSIVRGTTTKQIVRLLFDAGAKEVHVRITAPPIQWPCFYGIDMAKRNELIAARMSVDDICKHLGATSLGYLDVGGAVKAVGAGDRFCTACFTGNYPIKVPRDLSKESLEMDEDHVGTFQTVTGSQRKLPGTV
jgi:amidophosphoribosyltransferase